MYLLCVSVSLVGWELEMKCMSFDTDEKATSSVLRPNNKYTLM